MTDKERAERAEQCFAIAVDIIIGLQTQVRKLEQEHNSLLYDLASSPRTAALKATHPHLFEG